MNQVNSLFVEVLTNEMGFLFHAMAMRKKILQCPDVEGQYQCERYPTQVLGASWHSLAGNYTSGFSSKEVDNDQPQPTQYIG
jgi:hypothetical protein